MLKTTTLLLSLAALGGAATLAGTSVTGSLTFPGDPSNYFDPGYGFVPSTAYLNASGTTVIVSNAAVEFGYHDGASLISADFSGNGVVVSDLIELSGPTNAFQLAFTDSAFAGQSVSVVSDSFPFSSSLGGDVLRLNYAGANPTAGQTFTASFLTAPVPEPSTLGFVSLTGVLWVRLVKRRYSVRKAVVFTPEISNGRLQR